MLAAWKDAFLGPTRERAFERGYDRAREFYEKEMHDREQWCRDEYVRLEQFTVKRADAQEQRIETLWNELAIAAKNQDDAIKRIYAAVKVDTAHQEERITKILEEQATQMAKVASELATSIAAHQKAITEAAYYKGRSEQLFNSVEQSTQQWRQQVEIIAKQGDQITFLAKEMADMKREGFSRPGQQPEAPEEAPMTEHEKDELKIRETLKEFVAEGDPEYRNMLRESLAELGRGTPCKDVVKIIRAGLGGVRDDVEEFIPPETAQAGRQ